jgi:hypothetical protein
LAITAVGAIALMANPIAIDVNVTNTTTARNIKYRTARGFKPILQ